MKWRRTRLLGGLTILVVLALGHAASGGTASCGDPGSKALSFPFSYTGEGFGNMSGGYKQGAIYEGLLSIGVKGDLEKMAHWKGGTFLLSGIDTHGASLTNKFVHDANAVSNIDAPDSIRLYEVWFQQELADGKLSIRLGQILADTEFFVSSNASLFINGAFGALPLVSLNMQAPFYPVAAPGLRLQWQPSEALSLQAGIFDGDVGNPAINNKNGIDWRLDHQGGLLGLAEIACHSAFGSHGNTPGGVYKLGIFFHNPSTSYTSPSLRRRSDAGCYLMADQPLWQSGADQVLSGFFRIGGAPADRNLVPFYFDTGFNYKGLIEGRTDDVAGVAFSYTNFSGSAGAATQTHHEAILEATYKAQVNGWFCIQPDCQYLFNPGGTLRATNSLIGGFRFTIIF